MKDLIKYAVKEKAFFLVVTANKKPTAIASNNDKKIISEKPIPNKDLAVWIKKNAPASISK